MWKSLIHDLKNLGFRQTEIASYCKCSQSCIANIASGQRGRRLNFDVGSKLMAMHKAAMCGQIKPTKRARIYSQRP